MTDQEEFGVANTRKAPVDFKAIRALFDKAIAGGITKMAFHTVDGVSLSLAPMNGRNPGAIYVKEGETYYGKITEDKFTPAFKTIVPEHVYEAIRKITIDPIGEAVAYGRKTNNCAICNRTLTDARSVAIGIGPICAGRIGYVAEEVSTVATAVPVKLVGFEDKTITFNVFEMELLKRAMNLLAMDIEDDAEELTFNEVRAKLAR